MAPYCDEYNVEIVQGTVTQVSKTNVTCTLLNGQNTQKTIAFDVCVVATGAGCHWKGMGRSLPDKPEDATAEQRLEAMSAEGKRLLDAKSVVIVGGGLIGTELAGDLAAYAKKKTTKGQTTTPAVTLIHSGPQLCPVMSPPAAAKMQQLLENLGVTIILNEKGTEENGKVVLENSKKEIEAEIVIKTIGFQAMNDFMKKDFADALDEKGWIKTDEYMAVPGSDNKLFAYGDCSPSLPNAGNVYMNMASTLGNNVKAALLEKTDGMKKFELPPAGLINTAGPDHGVFYSSFFWTQRLLPWLKNKTMFFFSARDTIGVKKEYTMAV